MDTDNGRNTQSFCPSPPRKHPSPPPSQHLDRSNGSNQRSKPVHPPRQTADNPSQHPQNPLPPPQLSIPVNTIYHLPIRHNPRLHTGNRHRLHSLPPLRNGETAARIPPNPTPNPPSTISNPQNPPSTRRNQTSRHHSPKPELPIILLHNRLYLRHKPSRHLLKRRKPERKRHALRHKPRLSTILHPLQQPRRPEIQTHNMENDPRKRPFHPPCPPPSRPPSKGNLHPSVRKRLPRHRNHHRKARLRHPDAQSVKQFQPIPLLTRQFQNQYRRLPPRISRHPPRRPPTHTPIRPERSHNNSHRLLHNDLCNRILRLSQIPQTPHLNHNPPFPTTHSPQ